MAVYDRTLHTLDDILSDCEKLINTSYGYKCNLTYRARIEHLKERLAELINERQEELLKKYERNPWLINGHSLDKRT